MKTTERQLTAFLLALLISVIVWVFWLVLGLITLFAVIASFLFFVGVTYAG